MSEVRKCKLCGEVVCGCCPECGRDLTHNPAAEQIPTHSPALGARVAELVRAAAAVHEFILDHPTSDFDMPDDIYLPFVNALSMPVPDPAPPPADDRYTRLRDAVRAYEAACEAMDTAPRTGAGFVAAKVRVNETKRAMFDAAREVEEVVEVKEGSK